MSLPSAVDEVIAFIKRTASQKKLSSVKLYEKVGKDNEIKMILIKPVELKQGYSLSFVYRHQTKDITKNFSIEQGMMIITQALGKDFMQAEVKTAEGDWHLIIQSATKAKLKKTEASCACKPTLTHDKIKNRLIKAKGNIYLQSLGVVTKDGKVKNDMQDKYRQINKYIEIMDGILKNIQTKDGAALTVADMGAGKGYLTFALYDYLVNVLHKNTTILGVEMRPELVASCNKLARKTGYDGLQFVAGKIEDIALPELDVLIALHACNTATDDAIFRGIQAGANVIVAAPCCHKQIRGQLNPDNEMADIVCHGILAERQAELLTDGMRAMLLEACGYKTRVFEFISTEHTPKNVLIVAVRKNKKSSADALDADVMKRFDAVKKMYGIKEQHLESLLLKS